MFSIAKALSGVISVTVGAISFAAPVAFKSGGTSRTKRSISESINPTGGGAAQISISKCAVPVNSDSQEVDFATQQVENICGNSDLKDQIANSEDLSILFQGEGQIGGQDGKKRSISDKGVRECSQGENGLKGSIMPKSGYGDQYLGLCDGSQVTETLFVKKVQKPGGTNVDSDNEDRGTLQICNKNCGTQDPLVISIGAQVLETEQSNNWKEVKFYKN